MSIKNKIPDEIFFNKKAKINHIKVFGCIAYYINFSQEKIKFEPNSKKGVFLDFSEKSNCNIIMDYYDYKIHLVREIHCLEDTPQLKLANNNKNEYGDPNFLDFNFNFSNLTTKNTTLEDSNSKIPDINSNSTDSIISENNLSNIIEKSNKIENGIHKNNEILGSSNNDKNNNVLNNNSTDNIINSETSTSCDSNNNILNNNKTKFPNKIQDLNQEVSKFSNSTNFFNQKSEKNFTNKNF